MPNADYDKDINPRFYFYIENFMKNTWEAIIGMEIHVQLATETYL